jgi:AraC-like DNA-binding protein
MAVLFDRLKQVEPSPDARRLLWHVLSVGTVSRDEPERREAHDKPGAFLFWVHSGRGTLHYRGASWRLARGSRCWLLDLRHPRQYVPARGCKLVTSGMRFAGPGVESWLDALGRDNEFVIARRMDMFAIQRTQQHILELVTRRPRGYEWHVHLLVTHILGVLLKLRAVLAESRPPIPRAVARVVNAVRANPLRKWQVSEVARLSGISYSGLRTKFKEAEGETLANFLRGICLEQARLLLSDPGVSCKQVAERLDFSSEHEFSHFFHRVTGMRPTQ